MFLYIVSGEVTVAGQNATAFHLVHMNDDGDAIELQAVTDAVVIFGHAAPLREPIAAHGPFVMNTGKEIVQAVRDYLDPGKRQMRIWVAPRTSHFFSRRIDRIPIV